MILNSKQDIEKALLLSMLIDGPKNLSVKVSKNKFD